VRAAPQFAHELTRLNLEKKRAIEAQRTGTLPEGFPAVTQKRPPVRFMGWRLVDEPARAGKTNGRPPLQGRWRGIGAAAEAINARRAIFRVERD